MLAMSAVVYSRCTSYREVGLVKGTFEETDEQPFLTVFQRPGSVRFESIRRQGGRADWWVCWGAEPEVSAWWNLDGKTRLNTTIQGAIAAPMGFSGLCAGISTDWLMGRRSWVEELRGARVISEEELDGRRCVVVRGDDLSSFPCDVWLDAETLVLRKLRKYEEFPMTMVCRPELDPAVASESFQFKVVAEDVRVLSKMTMLGNGTAVTKELRELAGDPREGAIPVPEERKRVRWKLR